MIVMLKRVIYTVVLSSLLQLQLGCGMLIYPERQQNDRGVLDPTVVVLDSAGLFIGVLPGVIALSVDAVTGTIYKPKDSVAEDEQTPKVSSARVERRSNPKS